MKKIAILIIVLSTYLFSQSWNTYVPTTISEPNLVKMDLFTNKDGNHLVVQNSNSTNSIKYYLLSSAGSVIRTSTIETAGGTEFPNVSGDNDNVYLVYKSGNYLKAKKSTNAGANWSDINPSLSIGSNTCNGVDIVYGDGGLHVVYAMRDNYPNFETYYYKLNSSNSWVDYKNVTDYGSEVGGLPSIIVSQNHLYVSYNSEAATPPYIDLGVSKTRDKIGSDWQTPQLVSDGEYDDWTSREKIQVRADKVFSVFYDAWVGLGQYGYRIQVKSRELTATYWPASYNTLFTAGEPRILLGLETSSNSNLNITHFDFGGIKHKYFDGNNWSSEYTVTTDNIDYENNNFGFSNVSNDLFVTWKATSSDYIRYRQYDAAPLAPANYSVAAYQSGTNYYPRLTWSLNNEPDVRGNSTDAYKIERRTRPLNGTWSSWSVLANLSGTTSSYIDYSINNASGGDREAEYRITAVDEGNNPSPVQSVTIVYGQGILDKIKSNEMISDYSLEQNYPNPFNPSTKISYSIKEEGLVTLKVYDVLGNEIATLVNENKPAGNYAADFNSSQLPTGIYIYKLQAGDFVSSKKMILLK